MWGPVLVAGPNLIQGIIMIKNPPDIDLSKPRTVVYHEKEAKDGMMVYSGTEQEWFDKGWVNTPAKFGKGDEAPENEEKPEMDMAKHATEITDASDLSDYLNEKYDLKTNFRMGIKKLQKILKGKLDDNSSEDN
jgi:hypothetical protein